MNTVSWFDDRPSNLSNSTLDRVVDSCYAPVTSKEHFDYTRVSALSGYMKNARRCQKLE